MLKKSFALGLLAAFALAPAAFAGQTQGNGTNTVINAGNVGEGNVIGITNSTNIRQSQGKKGQSNYWCNGSTGPQVQGNVTNTAIAAANVGIGNVAGITNATNVRQRQVAKAGCGYGY
jgi:hypothetical protein